jgi:hypothetical protein
LDERRVNRLGCLSGFAALAIAPAVVIVAWWLWKREVSFPRDHWRFTHHIAGTALERFPIVSPSSPPVYRQRMTSGLANWIEVTYATRTSLQEIAAGVATACPEEDWAKLGAAQFAERQYAAAALSCGRVQWSVGRGPTGLSVHAFVMD